MITIENAIKGSAILLLALAIGTAVAHYHAPVKVVVDPSDPTPVCQRTLDELNIVAHVANATGRLPGTPKATPTGVEYKINPAYCDGKK